MKIKIHDHDTSHAGKRAGFLFNIVFGVGNEHEHGISRNLAADFADITAYLEAAAVIDGSFSRMNLTDTWPSTALSRLASPPVRWLRM